MVDEVAELMTAGDAELGVGAVQVRGDGAGRQEQPVGDLAVGQAAAREDDDLALLRGEPGERAGIGRRGLRGHAAGAQFGFRAPGPRRRTEAAERFQGVAEDGLGVVDPALPSQPLSVVQLKLGPLERPGAPGGLGQQCGEIRPGIGRLGEESVGRGGEPVHQHGRDAAGDRRSPTAPGCS